MFKLSHIPFAFVLSLALSSTALAQGIDQWEPANSAASVPTSGAKSFRNNSAWIGYSDGSVYFTTDRTSSSPSWKRMDKSTSMGHPVDANLHSSIAMIASADSYDDYVAYVGLTNERYYGRLLRVTYNRGGLTWTDLSAAKLDVRGVSVNPLDTARVYVPGTYAAVQYSLDRGNTWQNDDPNDPLTPPSGAGVSAVTTDYSNGRDTIVVATRNGEVWLLRGARTDSPKWQSVGDGLPSGIVTKVEIDERDASGNTLYVVVNSRLWATYTGSGGWKEMRMSPAFSGYPSPTPLVASVSPNPHDLSMFAQITRFSSTVRSDDGGRTWFGTSRSSGRNLAVEYMHRDGDPQGNQIMPSFRVRNMGSVPVALDGLTFKYFFQPEGSTQQAVYCDWANNGCNHVESRLEPGVLTLTIRDAGGMVAPGDVSGAIQVRVANTDWSAQDQSNDSSYLQDATDWRVNNHVILTNAKDEWLWGTAATRW